MKRLHVHVAVVDVNGSISFYSALFGAPPVVVEADYAKWMLDDPRVNFAISSRGRQAGIDHLGIQAETQDELAETAARLKAAGQVTLDQEATTCCYARSDNSWALDPAGLRWETFFTLGSSTVYGEDVHLSTASGEACCTPVAPQAVHRVPSAALAVTDLCCSA